MPGNQAPAPSVLIVGGFFVEYLVHNGSRSRSSRTLRALLPEHGGHKQYVMNNQRRLVSNRPLQLSESQLSEYREEFCQKESKGLLYVTTLDGRPVDIATLFSKPVAPESPLPRPRLDSAAYDKPVGTSVGVFRNEPAPPAVFTMPVEPPSAAIDNPVEGLTALEDSEEVTETPKPRRGRRSAQ